MKKSKNMHVALSLLLAAALVLSLGAAALAEAEEVSAKNVTARSGDVAIADGNVTVTGNPAVDVDITPVAEGKTVSAGSISGTAGEGGNATVSLFETEADGAVTAQGVDGSDGSKGIDGGKATVNFNDGSSAGSVSAQGGDGGNGGPGSSLTGYDGGDGGSATVNINGGSSAGSVSVRGGDAGNGSDGGNYGGQPGWAGGATVKITGGSSAGAVSVQGGNGGDGGDGNSDGGNGRSGGAATVTITGGSRAGSVEATGGEGGEAGKGGNSDGFPGGDAGALLNVFDSADNDPEVLNFVDENVTLTGGTADVKQNQSLIVGGDMTLTGISGANLKINDGSVLVVEGTLAGGNKEVMLKNSANKAVAPEDFQGEILVGALGDNLSQAVKDVAKCIVDWEATDDEGDERGTDDVTSDHRTTLNGADGEEHVYDAAKANETITFSSSAAWLFDDVDGNGTYTIENLTARSFTVTVPDGGGNGVRILIRLIPAPAGQDDGGYYVYYEYVTGPVTNYGYVKMEFSQDQFEAEPGEPLTVTATVTDGAEALAEDPTGVRVFVDGIAVGAENYSIAADASGRFALDFTSEFLGTLSAGSHIVCLKAGNFSYVTTILVA